MSYKCVCTHTLHWLHDIVRMPSLCRPSCQCFLFHTICMYIYTRSMTLFLCMPFPSDLPSRGIQIQISQSRLCQPCDVCFWVLAVPKIQNFLFFLLTSFRREQWMLCYQCWRKPFRGLAFFSWFWKRQNHSGEYTPHSYWAKISHLFPYFCIIYIYYVFRKDWPSVPTRVST